MRILLISSSFVRGHGYLDHCIDEIADFLGGDREILFVPYAYKDREQYARLAADRFSAAGRHVQSLHVADDPVRALEEAGAIFVAGGNTFLLLKTLYDQGLVDTLRRRVQEGLPFIGASAGAQVACPTIATTSDMPIVWPPSFRALDLIPFNINTHYHTVDPSSQYMGETRHDRIREFQDHNDQPVLALKEACVLRIEGLHVWLTGDASAYLFAKGGKFHEVRPGDSLDFLLTGSQSREG